MRCDPVISANPLPVVRSMPANTGVPSHEEMTKMARRRFQDPKPFREGNWWYIRMWQDKVVGGVRIKKLARIKLAPSSMPEREVKKLAAEHVRPLNQGLITVGSGVNFAGYVTNTYLPTELPLLAKTVQDSYQGMLKKHINPAFGNMTLGEMDAATLQRFFSAMPSRGIQYPTMRKNLDALSSVLRSAVRYGYLAKNPLENLRLPPDKRGRKPKPFISPAQFHALLELIPEPYATMIFVDVWTGLRISELCGLKWRSINSDSITISERFCRGDWSCTKTHASAATVHVDAEVIERIQRLKTLTVEVRAGHAIRKHKLVKSDAPDDLVFQSVKTGTTMNDHNILSRFIRPAARKLGLVGVHWRCLRTSFVTWMVQAGANPKAVQGLARHSRNSTTMDIYAQFVPEGQRRAVEQMGVYVRRAIADAGIEAGTLPVQ
jgi:integrase